MEGFERDWLLDTSWKLRVREDEEGWSIQEAVASTGERPPRWSDATGAFGAPSDEFRMEGRSGTWNVRVYPAARVVSSCPVPGGRLRLPEGWWMEVQDEAGGSSLGLGAKGTSSRDLERNERRGWEAWLGARRNPDGAPVRFAIVRDWHRRDDGHGDTRVLQGMAPIEGEASLRDRMARAERGPLALALDCRGLDLEGETEERLADGFLFAHQAFGARWLCWDAPPSAVVVRALERAHMDAQGELFGAWVAGPGRIPARADWRRLGPVLRSGDDEPDCYVWEP